MTSSWCCVPGGTSWKETDPSRSGFPATLEIRENLERMSFHFSIQGKLKECEENIKNHGNLREFDSDPKGKGFCRFGICASCALCPCCIH